MKRCAFVPLVLLALASTAGAAGPPPLDRPSPPPCCADGLCYPKPNTFGWYETRWRRWPTEYLEPTPAGVKPPAPAVPDVRTYETPTPEEEDRRAPPPTRRPEQPPAGEAPAGAPREPAEEAPPTGPLTPEPEAPSVPPMPWDEPIDTAPAPTPPPLGEPSGREPTSDSDLPPALPFQRPVIGNRIQSNRAAVKPASMPTKRQVDSAQPASSNDPPPALPLAMTSWSD